jgi:nucleotide-binding universal stress UspA family protein
MRFRKILCPIDFSPGSNCAMRTAIRIANESGAALELVHAFYVPAIAYAEYMASAHAIQQMSDEAERLLDATVTEANGLGAQRLTSRIVSGIPWTAIVEAAADPAVDLVVIGTHGRTGLARVLLGSVAENVIRHAPCSVMAVRPDGEAKAFQHVLCPTDFTHSAQYSTEIAAMLVTPGAASIALLHVRELPLLYRTEPLQSDVVLDKNATARLEQHASDARKKVDVRVEPRLRAGAPGAEILREVDEDPTIDLVVMGSHGRTGIKRALLGSVAEKVVRHARCPVVVARRRSEGGTS